MHVRDLLETRLRLNRLWQLHAQALDGRANLEAGLHCGNAAQRLDFSAQTPGR